MMVERLDGYDHVELLGGGMSRVYRATRRRDGSVVALKSVARSSEDLARAERRGAEHQKQFHSVEPRVPNVWDIRVDGDQLLIEMEYVAGEDLSTVIRARGRLPAADAVRIAAGLADVLDRAHQFTTVVDGEPYLGIIHGDLKPRNVRLVAGDERLDRRIRVLDFGVAKGIRGGGDGETRNVFGSAPYMAPERLIDGTVSPATDCWSLGVVLCEMLTGRPPFAGSERDVLSQIERGVPALPPDCPADLTAIVTRLLARQPRARYPTAAAIRDDLTRWLDATRKTLPVAADAWTPPAIPTGPPAVPAEATRRTTAPRLPRRRGSRWPYVLAAGLLFWVVWNVGREVRVWKESNLLGRRVLAAEPAVLDDMWKTYGSLNERSSFGFGTWPARGPLRLALVQQVDRVLDDFRRPEPTVRENHWKQARAWAAAALELGGDAEIRARWLICDAHLKRIAGDTALRRGQVDQARRLLNDAISQFEQASTLARRSPDPWLGLLRLYAGSRRDPDQAQRALNEAVRRNYAAGPREYSLLGDAASDKAEEVERGCSDLKETDLERKCLEDAKKHFERAVDWYQKGIGYGSASRGAAESERGVRRIDAKIDDLDQVPWFLRLLKRVPLPSRNQLDTTPKPSEPPA